VLLGSCRGEVISPASRFSNGYRAKSPQPYSPVLCVAVTLASGADPVFSLVALGKYLERLFLMPEIPQASILLVDDRPENLLALRAILEPLDCTLIEAHSGTQALKYLLGHEFALILMDVQMPGLDGFETAELIKEREKTRHIPIIFVTALSKEQHYVFRGYTSGAVDYISKPFDPDILRSKVAIFVELWTRGEALQRQAGLVARHEQLEREHELAQRERALAEKASRAKSEFIAGISHELRTPLNAILGFSKLLLNPRVGPLNEDQRTYTQDVVHSAEHLLGLINDILDLSKIEAGKMTLDEGQWSVPEMLESSLVIVRDRALEHALRLSLEVAPEAAAIGPLAGDPRKIKQVLFNLLSNAVKFTLNGGSIVASAQVEEDDGLKWIEISVRDSGIGIAPENQERIFAAFEQVDSSYTRSQQGTGLGLALTKRIVEMHGGTIELRSTLGQGSTFCFRLPARPVEPPPALQVLGSLEAAPEPPEVHKEHAEQDGRPDGRPGVERRPKQRRAARAVSAGGVKGAR